VRDNPAVPFGGLQVVFAGDFFQLPPVGKKQSPMRHSGLDPESNQGWILNQVQDDSYDGIDDDPDTGPKTTFAYNARSWRELDPTIIYLTEQHRQDDAEFLEILNRLRAGAVTAADKARIRGRINAPLDGWMEPTQLSTHNFAVDKLIARKFAEIPGAEKTFVAETHGRKEYVERLAKSCLAPTELKLKTGALVMALKNDMKKRYVNGSIGRVVDFAREGGWPVVEFRNGRTVTMKPEDWILMDGEVERAAITQVPLKLAYAITVHKSQGMTLDAARVNLARTFEPGMGYVALSRVKSLDSLSLGGINEMAFQVHPEVLAKDGEFRSRSERDAAKFAKLRPAAAKRAKKIAKEKKEVEKRAAPLRTSSSLSLRAQRSNPENNLTGLPRRTSSARNDGGKKSDPGHEKRAAAWKEKLAKMRETYPNAYKPWSEKDDVELAVLIKKEKTVKELTEKFGRHPGSIKKRLEKILGETTYENLKSAGKIREK
jgi:hypothetical protein